MDLDLDLNRVAVFVSIAEAKGVTSAATRAKLPKSSVSRALTQLEDELGIELVVRRSKTFQLTEAGQRFYDLVAKGLATVREAREELRPDASEPRGFLRVAAPPTFASFVVAPTLVAFTRRYPEVEAELCVTSAKLDPARDGFDVVMSVGPLEDSSAMVRRLGGIDLGIFAAKSYLAERGRPKRLSDIAQHDCVLQSISVPKNRWQLRGPSGSTTDVTVHGRVTVDDQATAIMAAAAGAGLVLLPTHVISRDPTASKLERVLTDFEAPGPPAQLVYAASKHVPLRISMFVDTLLESMKRTCTEH